MHKRIVIALMLMLSVFVFVGCSSDDETEDSKADFGPTTIAVEDTGPDGLKRFILLLVWMI